MEQQEIEREAIGVSIRKDLAARLRVCVAELNAHNSKRTTISGLVERAIEVRVTALEREIARTKSGRTK